MATLDNRTRVTIAGFAVRAAAESAARAGFAVTAIDAFADLDQHPSVTRISIPRGPGHPFTAQTAAERSRAIASDAVAYLSNFENHGAAVRTLAKGRKLWGNAPAVLRRVRDPMLVARVLARRGFVVPEIRTSRASDERSWLVKPVASGGGHGVRLWTRGSDVPSRFYLQELVDGTPGSIVFVGANGSGVPLGLSRQLVGVRALGSHGYQYCGNILAAADDPQFSRDEVLCQRACALVRALVEEFHLVGVNGVDFIARDGVPHALEVNPRWCASMELVERAYRLPVFKLHAAACEDGQLPAFDLAQVRTRAGAVGKAIVFAKNEVIAGDTRAWLTADGEHAAIRDVPRPGERIMPGRPVCTVFAEGTDAIDCHRALVAAADGVYAALASGSSLSRPGASL